MRDIETCAAVGHFHLILTALYLLGVLASVLVSAVAFLCFVLLSKFPFTPCLSACLTTTPHVIFVPKCILCTLCLNSQLQKYLRHFLYLNMLKNHLEEREMMSSVFCVKHNTGSKGEILLHCKNSLNPSLKQIMWLPESLKYPFPSNRNQRLR